MKEDDKGNAMEDVNSIAQEGIPDLKSGFEGEGVHKERREPLDDAGVCEDLRAIIWLDGGIIFCQKLLHEYLESKNKQTNKNNMSPKQTNPKQDDEELLTSKLGAYCWSRWLNVSISAMSPSNFEE